MQRKRLSHIGGLNSHAIEEDLDTRINQFQARTEILGKVLDIYKDPN